MRIMNPLAAETIAVHIAPLDPDKALLIVVPNRVCASLAANASAELSPSITIGSKVNVDVHDLTVTAFKGAVWILVEAKSITMVTPPLDTCMK